MTTEIKFNPSLSAAVAAQGTAANEQPSVLQEKQVAPLLSGENVRVSSGAMSDLEKLVARLRSEDDNTRTDLTRMKLTAVMTALDTANVRLTNMQAAAFALVVVAPCGEQHTGVFLVEVFLGSRTSERACGLSPCAEPELAARA